MMTSLCLFSMSCLCICPYLFKTSRLSSGPIMLGSGAGVLQVAGAREGGSGKGFRAVRVGLRQVAGSKLIIHSHAKVTQMQVIAVALKLVTLHAAPPRPRVTM